METALVTAIIQNFVMYNIANLMSVILKEKTLLQIVAVCALLVRVMGFWPAFAGLMTTFVLMPASSFLGRRLARARKAIVGHTDARVKLTTEVKLFTFFLLTSSLQKDLSDFNLAFDLWITRTQFDWIRTWHAKFCSALIIEASSSRTQFLGCFHTSALISFNKKKSEQK